MDLNPSFSSRSSSLQLSVVRIATSWTRRGRLGLRLPDSQSSVMRGSSEQSCALQDLFSVLGQNRRIARPLLEVERHFPSSQDVKINCQRQDICVFVILFQPFLLLNLRSSLFISHTWVCSSELSVVNIECLVRILLNVFHNRVL